MEPNHTHEEGTTMEEGTLDLILESAVIQYLADKSPEAISEFETFVATNQEANDLLEKLCVRFPDFEVVIAEQAAMMIESLESAE